jgi:hypothetical protein
VYIKRGEYKINDTINVRADNVTITGEYPRLYTDPQAPFPVFRIYNSENVRILRLIIDMQTYDWDIPRQQKPYANTIRIVNSKKIEIAHNVLGGSWEYVVQVGGDPGYVYVAPCEDIWIHHNQITGGRADGINVAFSKQVIIESNIIKNTGDDAISLFADVIAPVENVIVRNNIINNIRYAVLKLRHMLEHKRQA